MALPVFLISQDLTVGQTEQKKHEIYEKKIALHIS